MSGMNRWGCLLGVAIASANTFNPHCALAQITPDVTLPNNSIVTPSGNINIITGGTQAGNNLFHSFQQFSIPTGSGAFFNNAVSIQNIISRVTGGSISNIDGFIRTLGAANVFLLNPNGIIFGPNASLNVGGSFVATTANAIQFGTIGIFSADKPNATTPLLTINPSALLFNQLSPAAIINRSQAAAGTNPAGVEVTGLRVPDGKSLLLAGGNINLERGILRAYGGHIDLAGLAAPGVLGLNVADNTLSFSVPNEIPRANISLTNAGEINVRGADGGSIAINAQNLSFAGQSKVRAGIDTGLGTPQSKAGDIDINAKGATTLTDSSFIANVTQATSVGKGGNVNITTGSLALINGSSLNTSNFGQGDGGNINLNVRDALTLAGVGQNGLTSTIFSSVQSQTGNKGGSINIAAGSVSLADGAYMDVSTFGKGDAGSIFIQASDSVSLKKNSGIYSNVDTEGVGNSGSIKVQTGSLSVTEGSEFNTKTLGQGNAGNITINAREAIALDGAGSNGIFSRIISDVNPEGAGKAGGIQITTGSLKLTNGAFIASDTLGKGDAGNITIDARDTITFDGNSYAFSSVGKQAVGKGGDIRVTTGSLSLTNGAQLTTNVSGQGEAGNITINARDTVNLDGVVGSSISGVQSSLLSGAGKAGDIRVTTGSLSVTNGAALFTDTDGRGNGGNITIDARDTVEFDGTAKDNRLPSQASSTVGSDGVGNGGNIRVNARALLLKNGSQLNANNLGQGNAGKITINARDTVAVEGVGSDGRSNSAVQTSGYPGNGGDIQVTTGTLSLTNGGELSSYSQGGNAGNITINARDANIDGVGINRRPSWITSSLLQGTGKGGDIQVTTSSLTVRNGALLNSSTFGRGNGGNITIDARDTVKFDGTGSNLNPTGAYSTVESGGEGNAGNIKVTTGSFFLNNGGQINATTAAQGNAGDITIDARDAITLNGTASNGRISGVYSTVGANSAGKGGNIRVQSGALSLSNNAQINATTSGRGDAGNISVTVNDAVSLKNSDSRRVTIRDGAKILVNSDGTGNAGNITLRAGNLTLDNKASISAQTATSQGGNINLNLGEVLLLRRGSQISATAGTAGAGGDGGNITINAPRGFIVATPGENSDITANAFSGQGGKVTIQATGIFNIAPLSRQELERLSPNDLNPNNLPTNDITAISQQNPTLGGQVTLNTPDVDPSKGLVQLPTVLAATLELIGETSCGAIASTDSDTEKSRFSITGRGGLPPSPYEPLSPDVVWLDTRLSSIASQQQPTEKPATKPPSKAGAIEIVPATGWVFDGKGHVTLISQTSGNTSLGSTRAACPKQ